MKWLLEKIKFSSYVGSNLYSALTIRIKFWNKNNIFGVDLEDEKKFSFGASKKGKIWSYLR